ncbi:MAG: FAD-binding domain-containing protein [Pseudomonadota bacterium]
MNALVWLRNDLRIHDNASFIHAFKHVEGSSNYVFAVYCVCDAQWDEHNVAPARRLLVLDTLINLQRQLAARGVCLIVLDSANFDSSAHDVCTLAQQLNCDVVHCAYEYPLNERRRDKTAHQQLKQSDIALIGHHHSCLLPIGHVKKPDGLQYKVFTPFKKRFLNALECRADEHPTHSPDQWQQTPNASITKRYEDDTIALLKQHRARYASEGHISALYLADETQILEQLNVFCHSAINDYHTQRDIPIAPGTSQLSMYLSLGSLSVRTAYQTARRLSQRGDGYHTWVSELIWREFYRNIITDNPRLSMGYTFKPQYQDFPWRTHSEHFEAWTHGLTGVPLVDAAMRQLNQCGWMHNRLRMVTAMFLTKYLGIDWRLGEQYFMSALVDGDFAANNGGWQWSASTGTDAAPYFRVLSPVRQAERFDPDAAFIKQFVPELMHIPPKAICQLKHTQWLDTDYPQPIVDLKTSKQEIVAQFKALLDKPPEN